MWVDSREKLTDSITIERVNNVSGILVHHLIKGHPLKNCQQKMKINATDGLLSREMMINGLQI
jgi:hypothetical protein